MEIRVLEYFLMIARKQSFSEAAKELHITQPTLSRQIKELEESCHVMLFKRDTRHVELTEEGRLLKSRADEILRLVRETKEELSNQETLSGDICIACPESNSMNLIVDTIKKMTLKHPHVKFHLYTGNAQFVDQMVDSGKVEFGIVVGENHLEKYDYFPLPIYETWGVYIPKDAPLASKEFLKPEDLRTEPLILSNQDMMRSKFHGWAYMNKEPLNIVATYNLINNGILLTKSGIGYCIGLDSISNNDDLCFRRLEPPLIDQSMVIWKKYHSFSKASEYFLSLLQENLYNAK